MNVKRIAFTNKIFDPKNQSNFSKTYIYIYIQHVIVITSISPPVNRSHVPLDIIREFGLEIANFTLQHRQIFTAYFLVSSETRLVGKLFSTPCTHHVVSSHFPISVGRRHGVTRLQMFDKIENGVGLVRAQLTILGVSWKPDAVGTVKQSLEQFVAVGLQMLDYAAVLGEGVVAFQTGELKRTAATWTIFRVSSCDGFPALRTVTFDRVRFG